MKALTKVIAVAAAAGSLAALTAPAHAATVFASTETLAAGSNFTWMNSGPGNSGSGGTLHGFGRTFFSLENLTPALDALQFVPVTFSLTATAVNEPATFAGPPTDLWSQPGINGNFSYTYTGSTGLVDGILLTHNEVLLSGVFTGAIMSGNNGSGSLNLSHGNGGVLTYASGIAGVLPPPGSEAEFAYNLLNVTPPFSSGGGLDALASFKGKGDGEFDFANSVPEPATWALMIIGFGGCGVMLRDRRRAAMATA
jgi:hypothetical protein